MDWNDFLKNENKDKKNSDEDVIKLPEIKLPFNINFSNSIIIILILVIVWLASGIYIVEPNQRGIVLRFGKYVYSSSSGIHWKLPYPLETVYTPNVTKVRREEIGFRIIDKGPPARYRDIASESLMLTGDENIVDIDIVIQYRISNPINYLFNVRKKRKAIRDAAEAAIREIVGKSHIDELLTTGKFVVQKETKELLQSILDKYSIGFKIDAVQLQDVHPPKEVVDSFKDVASAREDKNRMINEAQGYRNSIIPEARGKVSQIINSAEAYREEKINKAIGDSAMFTKMLKEYKKAKEITRLRIYLETFEKIFPKMKKIVIDSKGNSPVLPLLPLDKGLTGADTK